MKTKVLRNSFFLLAFLALLFATPSLIRALNEGREVPVLMYHGFAEPAGDDVWTVSAKEFERQMREMRADGRKAILPNQLALAAKGFYLLPRKPVVITMDDGFLSNVTIAEPIMRKYGMKGICYLILSHIEDTKEARSQHLGYDNLVWPEVREALSRGTLFFGSHSIRHQPFARRQSKELKRSRHVFHDKTGRKTNAYCYPNGHAPDLVWERVQYKNRFTTAMICGDRVFRFSCVADLYRIPRVSVYGGKHAFSISFLGWHNGRLLASAANAGLDMPVRLLLREKGTKRVFLSAGVPVRLGNGKSCEFHWDDLPTNLRKDALEIIVAEQNGLFTYGEPIAVPVRNP